MDQQKWNKTKDPEEMINYLFKKGLAYQNDIRIFAANCLNLIKMTWNKYVLDMVVKELIDYAEGRVSDENFKQFLSPVRIYPYNNIDTIIASALLMEHAWWSNFIHRIRYQVSYKTQCQILRDMFNPFEPQECLMLNNDIQMIAKSTFDLKLTADKEHLLILSDALLEVGYKEDEPIVCHLRNGKKHYYNCWAIKCLTKGE